MAARQPAPEAQPAPAHAKPREMDDWLNRRIFHPLAYRIAVALVPTPVTPNAVSVAGGLLVVAAAIFYTQLSWPVSVLLGFVAHNAWHVVDGADGKLARLTGKASPSGELVDGACDYLSHFFLYAMLAEMLDDSLGGWAWALAWGAGLSRALQSNHAESARRTYLWRAYGVPWLGQREAGDELSRKKGLIARIGAALAGAYVGVAAAVNPSSPIIDAHLARAAGNPREQERIQGLCRRAGRAPLRIQGWLGANSRTMLLGASMAAGSPLYLFVLECTVFHALLVWSIVLQRRANRQVEAALSSSTAY